MGNVFEGNETRENHRFFKTYFCEKIFLFRFPFVNVKCSILSFILLPTYYIFQNNNTEKLMNFAMRFLKSILPFEGFSLLRFSLGILQYRRTKELM